MKNSVKARPFLAAALLVALSFLMLGSQASALTPAGTEIRNQSVATYDIGGIPYTTSSNEVITIVDAIYVFQITPNATGIGAGAPGVFLGTRALSQNAAPGSTVYYSYKVENLGNAPDSYNLSRVADGLAPLAPVAGSVVIYRDANGNGQVDPGDNILTSGATAMGLANWGAATIGPIAQDDYAYIIVAYQVPPTAVDGDIIRVDIDGRSAGDNAVTDAVSNFNATTVADATGILTLFKGVDKTDANEGDTLIYTLSGSNTGNSYVGARQFFGNIDTTGDGVLEAQNEGILIRDVLDTTKLNPGTDAALNIVELSVAPATGLIVYSVDGTNWYVAGGLTLAGLGAAPITHIGLFIPDASPKDTVRDPVLAAGQGYGFSFSVPIITPLLNATITNNATVLYRSTTDLDRETTSNTVSTDVGKDPSTLNYTVAIGPMSDPQSLGGTVAIGAAAHPKIDDPLTDQVESLQRLGAASAPAVPDGRVETVGDRHAGQITYLINTVQNLGAGVDTFDITFAHALPAGYQVELLKSDGLTPLSDTTGNGIPDTGPLAVNGTYNVVVKVTIPGNAIAAANLDITLTATSKMDPTKNDITVDRLTSVLPASVDAARYAPGPTGTNTGDNVADDDHAQVNVNPGAYADFAVDVENIFPDGTETGARDTFNLTVNGVPAGWNYTIYHDANGNGVLDDAELIPVSDTGVLNPWDGVPASGEGQSKTFIVRVAVPAGQVSGLTNLDFVATSTLNPAVDDTVVLPLFVNEIRAIKIEPHNTRVSVRGGVVTYAHQVTNIGNSTENWTLSLAHSLAGWSSVFVAAGGANIGPTQALVALAPGATVDVFVKVFVPLNAPVGAVDLLTVTVTSDVGPVISGSAIDQTTVIEGNLQLDKTVTELDGNAIPTLATQAPQAAGNDYHPLEYVTTYTNLGAETAENVLLTDAIPANTRIIVATTPATLAVAPSQSAAGAITYSNNGGISFAYVPAAGVDGSDPAVTHIRYNVGNVLPGASGTITFRVLID